jgi:hypothetical protein
MAFIRRTWTAKEADEWSKEDWITIIISPIIYILFTVGVAMAALLMPIGFILLGVAVLLTVLMVYVINPKLSVVSQEYEQKQKQYLEDLEKKVKWQD